MHKIIVMLLIPMEVALIWFWNYRMQTLKLLKKHQQEWDTREETIIHNGGTEEEIHEAYFKYITELFENSGEYGACFPRM